MALFYPWVDGLARRFVDRTVLRRADYRQLLAEVSQQVLAIESTERILDAAVARLEIALTAQDVRWLDTAGSSLVPAGQQGPAAWLLIVPFPGRAERSVWLESKASGQSSSFGNGRSGRGPVDSHADPPQYLLVIGELGGGRRLLSDDIAMLESMAHIVARRIDAVRVTHERCQRDLREQEIGRLATEAELRALQHS